jgi:hypothetical protein
MLAAAKSVPLPHISICVSVRQQNLPGTVHLALNYAGYFSEQQS